MLTRTPLFPLKLKNAVGAPILPPPPLSAPSRSSGSSCRQCLWSWTQHNGSPLTKDDHHKFVSFFRQASPYIEGHRGRTFVVVIPGNVAYSDQLLFSALDDVAVLHGLGVRVVVVLGSSTKVDHLLQEKGLTQQVVGGYRITDKPAMKASMEASGGVRVAAEAFLSRGPSIPMIRRHSTKRQLHQSQYNPAIRVVSGNYVAAKRRGIVKGIDFQYTGVVRYVDSDPITQQLNTHNIVILGNLGYSPAGEVLSCNVYDVGMRAAIDLNADKLIMFHLDEVSNMKLPNWLPLQQAAELCQVKLNQYTHESINHNDNNINVQHSQTTVQDYQFDQDQQPTQEMQISKSVVDLDEWQNSGYPSALLACYYACEEGVTRAHLIDGRINGGMLLELYSRDGIGTMISTDFYEGIRPAQAYDVESILELLKPLVRDGIIVDRSREQVLSEISSFVVIERENRILGCVQLRDLGKDANGVCVGEIAAFCVRKECQKQGRGDYLLDYVEQQARIQGFQRLILLTTQTADWFQQRGFEPFGAAFVCDLIPESRRSTINPIRNSQCYSKELERISEQSHPPAGKRIGY